MKIRKKFLWPSILLFLLITSAFYYLNKFNKSEIKNRFEEITISEGETIRNLIENSGIHLAEEGDKKLEEYLDSLYENENIAYIGLIKDNKLIYLLSQFEGYFPVLPGQQDYRITDTPMGKIFEITGEFGFRQGPRYRLHIGFDYEFLTTFENVASRNISFIMVMLLIVMIFVIGTVIYFDKKFYSSQMELLKEKEEKERFRELSTLTSEIAHEIKNPLNSIYLSFNVLENHCSDDPETIFYKDAIKTEIQRITGIIQSYTELAREIKPTFHEILLTDFIHSFRVLPEEEARSRRITLTIDNKNTGEFQTDPNILKQILLNLLKNSMEADAKAIGIEFDIQGKVLVIYVRDNGKGIEDKIADSIFKPYVSTKTRGMGLGLNITQRLVQSMNGQIALISREPGNTVFCLIFPLKISDRYGKGENLPHE